MFRHQADGAWDTLAVEEVIWAAGKQSLAKYICRRKATMVQWEALRLFLEVCLQETSCEGLVRKIRHCCIQGMTEEALRNNLYE